MSGKVRKIHACSYEWTILNLALSPASPGKRLYSPPFTSDLLGNTTWRLVLCPKGEANCEYMSLFIQRLADGADTKEVVIDYKITMDSLDSRFRFMEFSQDVCFEENDLVGHSEFARWDYPDVLYRDDVFVVLCEMSLSDRVARDGRWNQRLDFKAMSRDIKYMLEFGRHRDFVLVSHGCEFRVHKAVLAARSPWFRRVLEGYHSNKMDVSPMVPPRVLHEFLSLVYSATLDVPPNRVPPELIAIAEEFEMSDLVARMLASPKAYRARSLVQFAHKYAVWGFVVLGAQQSDRTRHRRRVKCDGIYCDSLIVACRIVHDAERGNGDYITVEFTLRGFQPDRPVFLSMSIYVVESKGSMTSIFDVFSGRYVFASSNCWKQTFPVDDFPLVVGDIVNLGFEFDISDGTLSDYMEQHDLVVPDRCPIGIDNLQRFSFDFGTLLDDDQFSDFIIVCGNETFRVHRCILAARSIVFERMLVHDMIEKLTGVVVIDDIRPEVVKSMLSYMYSGVLPDDFGCVVEDVMDLYAAADKYALYVLKDRCCSLLVRNLNVVNVDDVLDLALLHSDEGLECVAIKFIRARSPEVAFTI